MIMLYMVDLVASWLPVFNSYIIYIFALVCLIMCIKVVKYLCMI